MWNRNFTILWIGLLQSYFGSVFLAVGLTWLVLQMTGSAAAASLILVIDGLTKLLGPFAGVLAILTSDIGTFGKLFSEAIEAADRKPVEGVAASGGGKLHGIRFGVLPAVLPVMAGHVLYMFESNTRSSTIIGIVGAGGIGLMLSEMIRTLEWGAVSFIVLLVLVMVMAIDAVSGRLRTALIGRR